jgi:hypothetical protein
LVTASGIIRLAVLCFGIRDSDFHRISMFRFSDFVADDLGFRLFDS